MDRKLTVEYWMTKDVEVVDRDESVLSACRKMAGKKIGSVVVVDDKYRPVGIFTERDLLKKVVAMGFNARDMKVKDVMARNVITINVYDDYVSATKMVKDRDIRHLPVVDEFGVLVGIISVRDLRKIIE